MATSNKPQMATTIAELRRVLDKVRQSGRSIGLVPTMGALHEGHLSLVRASRSECDYTVVTIFVNPAQFDPNEDLDSYPRTLETDIELLAREKADLVFVPSNSEIYEADHATWVEVHCVSKPLEGQCRPEHFRGVTTVVLKLFNMTCPTVAFFGQKDYQQALVIQRMVRHLNVPVAIRVCPIIREPDGLAMSSRNVGLSPSARQRATHLWQSLCLARELVEQGQYDASIIVQKMRDLIQSVSPTKIDYVVLVDPDRLEPVDRVEGQTLAALAVSFDQVRLIDNCLLEPPIT